MDRKLFWACAAGIALTFAAPSTFAADVYKVSAQISHGEAQIGNPVLLVNDQSPASVSVSGENGYEFSVQLKRLDAGNEVKVFVQVKTSMGSVSSAVTTSVDRPIAISTGEMGLSVTVAHEDG